MARAGGGWTVIECPEIGTLSRKQIASLAGLAPMNRQSGQWQGKAFTEGGANCCATRSTCPLSSQRASTQTCERHLTP
ncbi:MAG: transposase [Roseinatronobacter sp.]